MVNIDVWSAMFIPNVYYNLAKATATAIHFNEFIKVNSIIVPALITIRIFVYLY